MKNIFGKLLGLAALSMYAANGENLYDAPKKAGMKFNPDYKVDTPKKRT